MTGERNGWRKVRFDQMAKLVNDRVEPAEATESIYVGLEHLDSENLTIERWGKPSDVKGTKYRVKAGQIIFGKRRFYQRKVAVAPFDCICSAHAMVLAEKPETVASGFLAHFMLSEHFVERALTISEGSLSPTIKWKRLAEQEFDLPPLDRQRDLVDLLSSSGCAHTASLRVQDAASLLQQAYLQRAYQEPSLTWVRFGDLLHSSTLNGLYKPKESYGAGPLMVHMGDLFAAPVLERLPTAQRVELTSSQVEKYSLREGDLLFARRSLKVSGAGKCIIVGRLTETVSFESSIIRARVDSTKADPWFLLGYFWSPAGTASVRRIVRTVAASGITASDLRNLLVPTTDPATQTAVSSRVQSMLALAEQSAHHRQRIEATTRASSDWLLGGSHS